MKTQLNLLVVMISFAVTPAALAEAPWKAWDCSMNARNPYQPVAQSHLMRFRLAVKGDRVGRASLYTSHEGGPLFARRPEQAAKSTAYALTAASASPSAIRATLSSLDRHQDRYAYAVTIDPRKKSGKVRETFTYVTSGGHMSGAAEGDYQCVEQTVPVGPVGSF